MSGEMSGDTATPGRRIRVLVAKPGLDGHDVGAKVVVRALNDAGMDAIYTGLRRSPEEIAEAAAREQVDLLGLSILSGAHIPLCTKVIAALRERGLGDLPWIVGGNVRSQDRAALEELGAGGVFATGTPFQEIVDFIRARIQVGPGGGEEDTP